MKNTDKSKRNKRQEANELDERPQTILQLPNGEKSIFEDLVYFGDAAGFEWQKSTLEKCAEFLAHLYGDFDEDMQQTISFDELTDLILGGLKINMNKN